MLQLVQRKIQTSQTYRCVKEYWNEFEMQAKTMFLGERTKSIKSWPDRPEFTYLSVTYNFKSRAKSLKDN